VADYEHLFTWKEEGFAELEQQLAQMVQGFQSDKVVQATVVKAMKRAVEPIKERAISLAPVDNENPRDAYRPIHMRDTIKATARIPSDADRESVYTNPTDIAIGFVSVKKSAVSLANEFGTSKRSAKPFLRPALAQETTKAIDILRDELSNIIPAYAARLEKKRK
jgi:HK97 gp10 family phage protein